MNTKPLTNLLCFGLLAFIGTAINGQTKSEMAEGKQGNDAKMKYAIAIHGGAGSSPKRFSDENNQRRHDAMKKALEIGTEVLKNGGTSLDAVEKVVRFLEDDSQFNAGVGAVFNAAGSHELDASIMDGKTSACGAVAGVTTAKNPISLARLVMTETRHVLLSGPGADAFAKQMKVDLVEPSHFDTPATLQKWKAMRAKVGETSWKKDTPKIYDMDTGSYMGTVGCVALDTNGNLAAATSTGGLTNKQFGRIGDSPIVGAGTFANNKTCAVSCTGIGEQFIRHAVAYDVAAQMKYRGYSVEKSVKDILDNRLNKGDGGIIAVAHDGSISMEFNTDGMARAAADSSGRFEVKWVDGAAKVEK